MLFASSTTAFPASIACVPTSVATRFTRATVDCLRFAGRLFDATFLALNTVFFTAFLAALRGALRATLREAFLIELFVRGPPRRRALPFLALLRDALFLDAVFLDALFLGALFLDVLFLDALFLFTAAFLRELDLRAFFFLVAIRCAPRDE